MHKLRICGRLVSGYGLRKLRSVLTYEPKSLGKAATFYLYLLTSSNSTRRTKVNAELKHLRF